MPAQPEPFSVGDEWLYGHYDVTREEVLDFASRYDPQPFHLSDEAAAASPFGRLAASGWHTCAMAMAVIARHLVERGQDGLGSGIDGLRWLKPVYPGDRLTVRGQVIEARASRSRPGTMIVRTEVRVTNQADDEVMRYVSTVLYSRRPAG